VARLTLWFKREAARVTAWRALDEHYAVGEFSLQLFGWDRPRRFVVIRERLRAERPSLGRKLLEVPCYTFRVFVTNLALPPEEIWRDYNRRADTFWLCSFVRLGHGSLAGDLPDQTIMASSSVASMTFPFAPHTTRQFTFPRPSL